MSFEKLRTRLQDIVETLPSLRAAALRALTTDAG
jgi:hypothetical protein